VRDFSLHVSGSGSGFSDAPYRKMKPYTTRELKSVIKKSAKAVKMRTLMSLNHCCGSVGSLCIWAARIRSVSQRYGSGSFYHQAKIVRKP
jgi:hypothetical protein